MSSLSCARSCVSHSFCRCAGKKEKTRFNGGQERVSTMDNDDVSLSVCVGVAGPNREILGTRAGVALANAMTITVAIAMR